MEITACPNCGSKNIGIGTLGDGIISGLSSWKEVCRNCGYQGASLVFDSEADYQKFIDALNRQKKQQQPQKTDATKQDDTFDLHKQTQEQQKLPEPVDELDGPPSCPEKKRYLFEFILAILLSIVFFSIMFATSYFGVQNRFSSHNDLFSQLLYLLASFAGVVFFFFFLIVFLEMIYRSINRKKK
jgi:transcription elongation factor Elf1